MAILAFDCCLSAMSVAVQDGARMTYRVEPCDGGQAERLLPLIEATVAEARLTLRDVTKIAVTQGPGGFTSVRVGIAAARGLALAIGCPVVGQSTLEALARAAVATAPDLPPGQLVAAIPAGRGGVYVQTFDATGKALDAPRVLDADQFDQVVISPDDTVVGPGASLLARGRMRSEILPRADILAVCAKDLTADGELRPVYLRAADAKPQSGKALARA